ncbi:MAG: U32 family peptidase [Chloroflexota bacterium]
MKILSPVDKVSEVEALIEAGAEELYCGLLLADWHNKYIAGAINRRPGGGANFTQYRDLASCVEIAHAHRVPVILTVNEHYYTPGQYPYLMDYLARVSDLGVDALMVADLALLLTLQEKPAGPKLYISTGGTPFNSEAVRFYQELGACRVTLPRHLNLEEMRAITGNISGIETEVFVLNSRCPYVDGFCTFQHGLAGPDIQPLYQNACMLPYDITVSAAGGAGQAEISWRRQHIWQTVHVDDHPCGACALFDFGQMGITSLKIVGRGNTTERKITDVKFLSSLLDCLAREKPSRANFRKMAQQSYRQTYGRPCREHLCYFPEILEKDGTVSFHR